MNTNQTPPQLTREEITERVVSMVESEAVDSLACLPEESIRRVFRQAISGKAFRDPVLELVEFIVTFADHAPTTSGRGQQKTMKRTVQAPKGVH